MNFYHDLIKKYMKVRVPDKYQELSKINSSIVYYHADYNKTFTYVRKNLQNIIEIDISSAFPTICNNLFDPNMDFIKKLNTIEDKKEKNIFIAITLKEDGSLTILNNICKLIITGIIFENCLDDNLLILELKKDGCVLLCDDESYYKLKNLNNINTCFTKYIIDNKFKFHTNEYQLYYRCNRTSLFIENNTIISKGIYKYYPDYILKSLKEILLYKNINHKDLLEKYNNNYLEILRLSKLYKHFNEYYLCSNKKILDIDGKYNTYTENIEIDPSLYLKLFIFPAILFIRSERFSM